MRTKEKFYENLRKKHVSLEKKIERFEFRDVKTLESLTKEGEKLINGHKQLVGSYDKASDDLRGYRLGEKAIEKQADELVKVRDDNKKKYEAAMANDQKAVVKMNASLNKIIDKVDEAEKKFNDARGDVKSQESMIKSQISEMNSAISAFENGAKALGVDVSSKVNKYKSMVSKLKEREDFIV